MALTNEQAALLSKNTLELRGEIDEATTNYFREALPMLLVQGSPDINLLITSPGGSLLGGLIIFDTLAAYDGQVTGTDIGFAQSMAVVVLQACALRQVSPNARLLIHNPIFAQLSLNVLVSQRKVSQTLADQEMYFQRIYRILSHRSGRSLTEVRVQCRREREMFPEEAKRFGLIDKIMTLPKG